ncbi:S41 family peptidase [Aquimarina gracilis]|uniref:Tricorn protease homolog n=1 Tax=Aquimarina gracilis TaxID=874422 RepID=A0ABU6A0L5_9FLAO|nr:S41 family peptidase [Aquimarina gracilis]MEB3347694.1 S41 family peptidase [Aquimarina gracilis]
MFKSLLISVSYLTFILFTFPIYAQEAFFTTDPTLSPDGKTIIFSYDGDLWKVPSDGGEALRITGMQGNETLPRVSPDGKWISFSATQYGNRDVYIMPFEGGEIRQLTYHDSDDDVDSWSWDSRNIYFTSSRENRFSGYTVSISGGTPSRLFPHYFNTVHNVVAHPISGEVFFNESWESKYFAHRKRYKGDYNPDIKSYNPTSQEYKEYTSYRGKDFWVTLDEKGTLYFVSDEANGEYNLYTFKNGQKTALTTFKTSIHRPQVSADGSKIVFGKDYQIYIYDVASNVSKKVPVVIYRNNTLNKTQDFKVKEKISYFDVSSDNKKIAFVSRGRLFVSDVKGKFIRQIPTDPKERIVEVKWLKNNRSLLYNRTYNGYLNLFTVSAEGNGSEKQITKDARNNVNIEIDTASTRAIYISGRDELRLLDLKSFKSTMAVKDEFWALYPPQPKFSPNGKYIVYNAIRDFENDIFTYHIPSKKVVHLSETGVTENSPFWSPDGKYIYFSSNLTQPSYPYGLREANVYRMALDKYEKPYTSSKFEELFVEEKDEEDDKKDKKETKTKEVPITINQKGLMDRIERISPEFGFQGGPIIISKEETTYVFYLSNHDEGDMKLWKTTIKPFEKNKTEKVYDKEIFDYQIAKGKDSHYVLLGGNIHTLNIESNKTEMIEIDFKFRKSLSEEFNQMFEEAWAGFEENFYDGDFHGEDWKKLKNKYKAYLPYITNRSHLRLLFNDMLGELNTSHFGFRSTGEEEKKFYKTNTLSTGIIFTKNDPYVVERIVEDSPADVANKNIRPGDRLIAVNGQSIDLKNNRESYFVQPSMDKEIQLTLDRNGQKIMVELHPIESNKFTGLLYDEWVDHNQMYVDQKSNKKVAYVHMKNMGRNELNNFKKEMVSEAYRRDALILDLRNNTGGNVHDEVLQFLSQKPYLQWKYREGKVTSQPNFSPAAKPIVVLINEQSLSDAEMTSAGFKQLGLGTVIGTETYRWIIFTSSKGLVDGSYYRLPSWGCYTLDGKNLEKTGVQPDIYVKENFKHRLDDDQPQLDRALSEIMKQLGTK